MQNVFEGVLMLLREHMPQDNPSKQTPSGAAVLAAPAVNRIS